MGVRKMAKKTTKKTVKKSMPKPVAKPAVKKAAKKPAAKAKIVVAKKPAHLTLSGKKFRAALKPSKRVKPDFKRVPPRIERRPPPEAVRAPEQELAQIDVEKAMAFAMSIAQEKKRTAAKADAKMAMDNNGIKLGAKPTTRTKGRSTVKFPASDLKEFRKLLLAARAKASSGVNAMKATGFNETEDREADGGDGTAQTLRLQALGQMGNINRTIQQIDEALHRIEDGTYGVCTSCGQLIRKRRLLNQPFVLTCMECQNAMEREAK